MAKLANVSVEDFQLFKKGTKIFTLQDNLKAFRPGNNIKSLSFAAQIISDFLMNVKLIEQPPDLNNLFDDRFVKAYAQS